MMLNKTINIGILGGGTAGAVNLVALLYHIRSPEFVRQQVKIKLTCIHDPKIPVTQVGESVTPTVCFTLLDALKFNILQDLPPIDGTLRFGARYFWDKQNGQTFDIPFTSPGLHVNSEKFSYKVIDMALKEFPNVIDLKLDRVLNYTQDKDSVTVFCENETFNFDYIIDCMGTPSKEELAGELYTTPDIETVNSVMLYPDFTETHEIYTSSYVHDNGWMFGVPLTHRKAYGYLYNRDITSHEEAGRHFAELKGIDTEPLRKISWKHYYRKKVIDRRVLTSGNRLYFFEPHMTLPLHFYNMIGLDFLTKIVKTQNDVGRINSEMNKGYADAMDKIQDLIALNYAGECRIKSPFWEETNEKAKQRLRDSDRWQHWLKTSENTIQGFFIHPQRVMSEYINGYKIDLKELKRKE